MTHAKESLGEPLPVSRHRFDYSPWLFWAEAEEADRARQSRLQRGLSATRPEHTFGDDCFVSELASIDNETLCLGPRSYVAAGAYLTGSLRTGRDCTINPYTVVRGAIELGDAVRIGAHTSLLAFNHTMSDPDTEVFRQPITSRGIVIGNDVWIGSHVVVLDGVTVGDRSVLAAGSVVTKDVPPGTVVGGNPAKVLRRRIPEEAAPEPRTRAAAQADQLAACVAAFADTARAQAGDVLARYLVPEGDGGRGLFTDRPGADPTVRAQCDAIEIADLLLGRAPDQIPAAEQVQRLRDWQDPASGMVGDLLPDGGQQEPKPDLLEGVTGYHVLSVGYALDILGSRLPHPVRAVAEMSAADTCTALESRPWSDHAWAAGDWVDIVATAHLWNRRAGADGQPGATDALFGWLLTHADPRTGVWGTPRALDGQLQVVNGFYRASRGTFAQFGLPLPYPERVVDTVLEHARDLRYTSPSRQNACNILDIAHPLWLTRQSGHRAEEVTALARRLLGDALGHWTPHQGFGFQAPHPTTAGLPATVPGLQGTEMWLAIIWYLADLAGLADALGHRPRGVHRPEPHPDVRP
ncbi:MULTISPECIES: DapH/DapD/GlmU-related protein [unclassified Streptomyces]|uniref:acyltransferase n=1 Tax=unclassified Streptomyces TaxID=2593676 RepID=UPI00278C18AB|nr:MULTISPECIES: acyltransferase [unclassified Streptomyces]